MQLGLPSSKERARSEVWAVDDDPDVRKLIRIAFKEADLDSFTILEDGEAVVERLRSLEGPGRAKAPDLVLLDLDLPGMDGLDVLKHLRDHPVTQRTRVVMFTTGDSPGARAKAESIGIEDWVKKPVDYHAFIATCQTLLRRWAKSK